jgi:beta-lactamase regulating signal transducer with metallopeptidase domain
MNDLGWTLGWLAVQVALVLVPAIGLHALASRQGPASGAWAATVGLGMVVVLGVLAFLPGFGGGAAKVGTAAPLASIPKAANSTAAEAPAGVTPADKATRSVERGWALAGFRLAWSRFERQAAGPVARFWPWGKALAVVGLAGSGIGLIRLLIGLWAVGLCRRRGTMVDDPGMLGLVEELRRAMGCKPEVEVREVSDLTTPATAGWSRPMLLLPGDWREWDESERRAVVAHELAHVVRGDYAAGLLARVAVVLNYYHPLVRWMAGRLHLDQELAADELGARFAGGRSSYLLALSRLALGQEGRPSSWPARAFLPARGTLIRRIAMLKNEADSRATGNAWSKARRLAMALGLLALTIGVASWKAPARAADDKPSPAPPADSKTGSSVVAHFVTPFEFNYIPENRVGVVGVRPAAILRRLDMGRLIPLIQKSIAPKDLAALLRANFGVNPTSPGWLKLEPEDIESVVFGILVDHSKDPQTQKEVGRLMFGNFTARTVAPFDWRKYLRQWNFEFDELREGTRVFYKLKGPLQPHLGPAPCVYFPDDQTAVFDEEAAIRKHLARPVPMSPAFVRGADWGRVNQEMIAIAIDNHDGTLEKRLDLGRPDDAELAMVRSMIRGVDRLVIGMADDAAISLRGEATTLDPKTAESLGRSIEALAKTGLAAVRAIPIPKGYDAGNNAEVKCLRMYEALLGNLKATPEGVSLDLRSEKIGVFVDFAAIVQEGILETLAKGMAEEAKADPKTEKR